MTFSHLKQIINFLNAQNYHSLSKIVRCDDNVIELTFDKQNIYYVDLQKSQSCIYTREDKAHCKAYQAAFDTQLNKRLQRTKLKDICLVDDDKVMRIFLESKGSYKHESISIQFEFTGKYTNAIILDDQGVVIEALRHIDSSKSSRSVRTGEKLKPIPKASFVFQESLIENVEVYLHETYSKKFDHLLEQLKQIKKVQLLKQLKKLQKERQKISTPAEYNTLANENNLHADIILANLYQIKPYATKLELLDFEQKPVVIHLDKAYANTSSMANALYAKSKKYRNKAKHLHIEEENLDQRISFVTKLIDLIDHAKTKEEINQLVPKQKKVDKKDKQKSYEIFWFDSYKILLGRNAKANQELLGDCKANDLWFHLKDRASAHVVIVSDKQKIPEMIIQKAAKLCVDFSVSSGGRYSVDYTKRKELQLQEAANVLYHTYDTIIIEKD